MKLKVYGNAYGNTVEQVKEIVSALEADGFVIGYSNEFNVIIMKQEEDPEQEEE